MSRENDLSQIETDRNLTEQQITTERGPDEIIAYPSQGVFVVPPEKWGPMKFPVGLSGSLTSLVDGTPYLIAGNNITITTGSKGQITIAAEGKISGAGGGAGTSGTAASIASWETYTPTIGSLTAGGSPTISSPPSCYLSARYVVQGKIMTLSFSLNGTGTGASIGNGVYTISLPTGYSIDTNIVSLGTSALSFLDGNSLGIATIYMNTTGASGMWTIVPATNNQLILLGRNSSTNSWPLTWSSTNFPFNTTGRTYSITFSATIPLA